MRGRGLTCPPQASPPLCKIEYGYSGPTSRHLSSERWRLFLFPMPKMMPEESLIHPNRSRSLGIALGATEVIYLLGLVLLATGSALVFGFEIALMVAGGVMILTAFYNAWVG